MGEGQGYEWLVGLSTAIFGGLYYVYRLAREYRSGVWQLYAGLVVFSLLLVIFYYWEVVSAT